MQRNFLDFVSHIFYETSKKNPEDEVFLVSSNAQYPTLSFIPEPQVIIPTPRTLNNKYIFEGILFEKTENGRRNLWSLFLASVYHLAAHTAVSQYTIYDKWLKNKTQEICWQAIDFIEDVAADKYLSVVNADAWRNIKNVNEALINKYKINNVIAHTNVRNKFSILYLLDNQKRINAIKEEIFSKRDSADHTQDMISYADMLYRNREFLSQYVLPYYEHHNSQETIKSEKIDVDFQINGFFEQDITMLDQLWNTQEENKVRILSRYKKYLKDLNFEDVIFPSGDINSYLRIKSRNNVLLRKIRDGIQMVTNIQDDPRVQAVGQINMQYAIQAIASESNTVEIFEQDEVRRSEEAWVILLDCSASMKLKFNKLKEFALCVAETANELTGRSDAWSLYAFDSKLTIVKDFKENYSQEVKARVGSLKSGGLSFVPDAVELGNRILAQDTRERKYLFVITDGQPSGDDKFEKRLQKIVKGIGMSGIGVIGIGMKGELYKVFNKNCDGSNLSQVVSGFIKTYRDAAADM